MRLAALWVCVMSQQLLAVRGEDQVALELGLKRVVSERSCECVPVYRCQFKTSTDGSGSIDIRVDRQGCPGLLDVCCPFTITRPPPATLSCGVQFTPRQVETRITGDDYAHYGQYPWMAALSSSWPKVRLWRLPHPPPGGINCSTLRASGQVCKVLLPHSGVL
ncbi:uncharacterized protein LOC124353763 [Homalodisca vitripennis]|uniref:uncharacterized protein LOC124353763 n=1 Tax=Homalodisca vitripennis TaxID=197043 RepID=UPI001EEB9433|nr:uncharacterized protein LOC124353763 [Homalodisca vitripennis]